MISSSKLDAEAMGLRYTDVRLVPKKLAGILVKANLPPNAPKMIMNGEVPEEMANLWKEKALQALRSMNEYYQNVGNRKMTRALREAK